MENFLSVNSVTFYATFADIESQSENKNIIETNQVALGFSIAIAKRPDPEPEPDPDMSPNQCQSP